MTNTTHDKPAIWEPFAVGVRSDIESGRAECGTKIGTEYEFMRQTGLSRTSIRRGIQSLIDEGLLERRVGKGVYVREPHKTTHAIQLVVPDMSIDLYVRITRSIQTWGRKHGVDVQLHDAHGSFNHDIEYVLNLPDKYMSGAIISSLYHPKFVSALFELKRRKYPFVLVGHHLDELEVPSVAADNYGGGYRVGQELVKLEHGRGIAFIGALRYQATARRLEGLKDAMSDLGTPYDRELFKDLDVALPCEDWSDLVQEKTSELLNMDEPPTAIVFGSTSLAASAYQVIKSRGLRIPEDISVAAFDDEPYVQFLDPPMSLIRQPGEEIGVAAIQMLMDRLKGVGDAEQVTLPVRWVPRGSIAKPGSCKRV